jgi:class 3 adenylate cyclase
MASQIWGRIRHFFGQRSQRASPVPADAVDLLANLDIFRDFPAHVLRSIASEMEEIHLAPNTHLFRQGDQTDGLFVVRSGTLQIVADRMTTELHLLTLEPGDCIREVSLVDPRVPNTASAVSDGPASVLHLSREVFERLAIEDPALRSQAEGIADRHQLRQAGASTARAMVARPSVRRLAAIMFSDIVGSTAVTAQSEEAGLRVRLRHRTIVRLLVSQYDGKCIEAPGDESLSTFESALAAVDCALAIQRKLADDPELKLHVGIHLSEIAIRSDEIFGDGVNIAARICALAGSGEVLVSDEVSEAISNRIQAFPLGERRLKNVDRPIAIFRVPGNLD